jgi:uncharacterized membrane protein
MPPQKPTLPDRITQASETADKILEATQNAGTKLGKRLLGIIAGIAVAIVLVYQGLQSFQAKTKDVLQQGGVQKLEEGTWRVRGKKTPTGSSLGQESDPAKP